MEMRTRQQNILTVMGAGLFVCAALLLTRPAAAEDAPRSYIASPDVYKVIAQNNKTRVILATWAPGQRDQWHSHPPTGVYRLTDCKSRVHTPDGKFTESNNKAGSAVVQAAIPSHSFENISDAECRAIIVEHEQ
jgi:beta-alanine degradation protein BauB